ncbi:MAG TPA: fibrobacter succinogenes major paralogous domain-containing protein, partial [Bacteroidales bacterium]|nr:fibrobacter succinogenes major paralogous domain-containing protein [Bacteroidales bacterium]
QSDTLGAQKYASVGTYRIRLQVRDADQLTDTVSKTLTVLPVAAGFQPCPGLPAVVYAGKQYTTVKIGSQCWLRENLDVGTMVSTATGQTGNAVMEKYCYENQSSNCQIFGGLYTWDEAMKYASSPQGICPLGWHIPSDAEWKLLEGHVDSQYDSLSGIWDSLGFRGYDAGRQLRSGSTWSAGGSNPDLYGFTALAGGGAYGASANFAALGTSAMLWTSEATGASDAMARYLDAGDDRSYRGGFQKVNAFSVRCIRD